MTRIYQSEDLTQKQLEILEGCLLGDAHISYFGEIKNNNSHFYLSQKLGNKDYVLWISKELGVFVSLVSESSQIKPKHDINGKIYIDTNSEEKIYKIAVSTHRHLCFTKLRHIWYPNKIKIVPKVLQWSPLMLTMWYINDGQNVPTRRSVVLHTQGFTTEDCHFLTNELKRVFNLEFLVAFEDGLPILRSRTKSYLDFIEIIKPFIIWDCFNYKFDLSKYEPVLPNEKNWTVQECNILLENKKLSIKKLQELLPKRSFKSISKKLIKLGCKKRNPQSWTNEEIEILKIYGRDKTSTELKELIINHSAASIAGKLNKMGISKTKECKIRIASMAQLKRNY